MTPLTSLLNHPDYDPNHLFDAVIAMLALKNDAALARAFGVAPPVISKMRRRTLPIGPALLIRLHEVTGLSIRDLRILMGDRRRPLAASPPHIATPGFAVTSDPPSRTAPDADNVGSVMGVYRRTTKEGGRIAEWWSAVSPNLRGQRRRSRFFSISKYGERQAFEMAVKARQAFVAELADVLHLPKHAAKQKAHRLRDAEDNGEPVSAAPQPELAPGP